MTETHKASGFLAWRRQHSLPPGTPCANCATVLQGPWCHACGQSGFDFHRHASHMIGETIESFSTPTAGCGARSRASPSTPRA